MRDIYFKGSSDGVSTEGIGSVVQNQLCCYALSKMLDCGYIFDGFKNLQHYQYFDKSQKEYTDDIDTFFNFKGVATEGIEGTPIRIPPKHPPFLTVPELVSYVESCQNPSSTILDILYIFHSALNEPGLFKFAEDNSSFDVLKKQIVYEGPKYFNKDAVNIAIHIRKHTQTDTDTNPVREYFDDSRKGYFVNVIKNLKEILGGKAEFHIYSQGDPKEFLFLQILGGVTLHIEEYPTISLYHLINADVLVMAKSSMSYISHLIGNPISIIRDNFYHQTYANKRVLVNSNGDFDKQSLRNLLIQEKKCI